MRSSQLFEFLDVQDEDGRAADLHLDRHGRMEARAQMMELTGRRSVPQIFVGATHVGGCDDLIALDSKGELDPLLNA